MDKIYDTDCMEMIPCVEEGGGTQPGTSSYGRDRSCNEPLCSSSQQHYLRRHSASGFFALLRTGEFLDVTADDLLIGDDAGIVSLKRTKSGLRNAAHETVSFDDPITLEILRVVKQSKRESNMHKVPIWTKSAQAFRNEFAHHCKRFHIQELGFRPYSLRRGGATHLFQETGSMEVALLKGRWNSTKVAKIYLSDGLSYLPGLTFCKETRELLREYSPINQL